MKSLKMPSAIACGVVVLVGLVWIVAPQSKLDALKADWQRYRKDPIRICADWVSKSLKDPDSMVIASGESLKPFDGMPEKSAFVRVSYRAKNSYGAYQPGVARCVVPQSPQDPAQAFSAGLSAVKLRYSECIHALKKGLGRDYCDALDPFATSEGLLPPLPRPHDSAKQQQEQELP